MSKLELLKQEMEKSSDKNEFERVIKVVEEALKRGLTQVAITPLIKSGVDDVLTKCGFKTFEPNVNMQIINLK